MNIFRITRNLLAVGVMGLAACTTTSPRVIGTPIRPGMTRAELQAEFGQPLRAERSADGGEDWYYYFGDQNRESRPFTESTVTDSERSYSSGHATTTTTTMTPKPIHLSAEGRVVGAIPSGSVIIDGH